MPFGLCNALVTFQRLIQIVSGNELAVDVLAYLNDVIIFAKDFLALLQEIDPVLQLLQVANLSKL